MAWRRGARLDPISFAHKGTETQRYVDMGKPVQALNRLTAGEMRSFIVAILLPEANAAGQEHSSLFVFSFHAVRHRYIQTSSIYTALHVSTRIAIDEDNSWV